MTTLDNQTMGDMIRELRIERGLTQQGLADRCDRHRTYVSLVERGGHSPTLDTLFRIAAALEIRPSTLVQRAERRFDGVTAPAVGAPQ